MTIDEAAIERDILRALSAAATLVPIKDYEPFINFARVATLRQIRDKGEEPIADVDAHFRHLAGVYLMHVTQTGKVLH